MLRGLVLVASLTTLKFMPMTQLWLGQWLAALTLTFSIALWTGPAMQVMFRPPSLLFILCTMAEVPCSRSVVMLVYRLRLSTLCVRSSLWAPPSCLTFTRLYSLWPWLVRLRTMLQLKLGPLPPVNLLCSAVSVLLPPRCLVLTESKLL